MIIDCSCLANPSPHIKHIIWCSMYSLCCYYLNVLSQVNIAMIYFLYYLPLDKTRILLNQSLSPHHRSNKVDCYVYIPQFHWYWSYHWHIPIHKYFTYIICIIGPIIGGRVVGVRVAPSTNVFVWMGIKIEFYAYRMLPCFGWMGGARLVSKVWYPRGEYIFTWHNWVRACKRHFCLRDREILD